MVKKYKPGQFISLGGKLYRVSKPCTTGVCRTCPIHTFSCPIAKECVIKLPVNYKGGSYPIPLKPKRQG